MIRNMLTAILASLAILATQSAAFAQTQPEGSGQNPTARTVFYSLSEVLDYSAAQSLTLQNNEIKMDQAKKAKLASVLGTIDVTGTFLSAQFTDNTTLGVNLFPAEIFGGEAGTFREVQVGVRYNTNLTSYADIKLLNPAGWANLKLSRINIDLTESNNQLVKQDLEENIAANYFNIVALYEQLESSRQNLEVADTLLKITRNKFEEGLVNQQDVNESEINYLNTEESIRQLSFLLDQYYISLKLLCDIPEKTGISIQHRSNLAGEDTPPIVRLSTTRIHNAILKEEYARINYKSSQAAFLPTLSLQLSNSNNLYNTEFQPLTGNWINSNYIGLNFNIPIPNSQRLSQKYNAQYEYEMARNNTAQARIQSGLDQQNLQAEYEKAVSQAQTDSKILDLRKDSFNKNQDLYAEGIVGLDMVLSSFNAMVNAQYNLIASKVEIQLASSKINIHNNSK